MGPALPYMINKTIALRTKTKDINVEVIDDEIEPEVVLL